MNSVQGPENRIFKDFKWFSVCRTSPQLMLKFRQVDCYQSLPVEAGFTVHLAG